MLYPIQILWGSKFFDSGISISFKRKCNIVMAYCSLRNEMERNEMGRNEMEICSLRNENV